MAPLTRTRASERRAGLDTRLMQARHQIARQERTIAGRAHDPFDLRCMVRGPVEAGQNAGERAGVIRHAIGDHSEAGLGEACRVGVGAENQSAALRAKPGEHALENGRAADADARLVAAAHAARAPAGEDNPEGCRICHEPNACWNHSTAQSISLCAAILARDVTRSRSAPVVGSGRIVTRSRLAILRRFPCPEGWPSG